MKKTFLLGFSSALLLLVGFIFLNSGASFNKYSNKLLKFEGDGYGIHKPIWGNKEYSKSEALRIHKHHYWNKYLGNYFEDQTVAEVFIDHIINAGPGQNNKNIRAFERIIGVEADGQLTRRDVEVANSFLFNADIVNPYVDYRIKYYKALGNKKYQKRWVKRASTFYLPEEQKYSPPNFAGNDVVVEKPQDSIKEDVIEDMN